MFSSCMADSSACITLSEKLSLIHIYGGMNLLGKVDVWDNLMRIKNHQVAAELLEIAMGTAEKPKETEKGDE